MDTEKNETNNIENNILNEQDNIPETETSISDVENNSTGKSDRSHVVL